MMRGLARGGWLVACAALVACSQDITPRTQVMVVIDAESQVRSMAADIDLEVRTGTGPVSAWDVRAQRSLTPGEGIKWPLEAALVPRANDANRVYLVAAIARDADGKAIAEVRAISGYQAGQTVTLLLLFENACLDKSLSCSDTQTCRRGECVDAHVETTLLPPYNPSHLADAGVSDGSSDGNAGSSGAGGGSGSGGAGGMGVDAQVSCNADADCDDADPCNGAETCVKSMCKSGKAVVCADSADLCRPNVCTNAKGKALCAVQDAKDGLSCKTGDVSSKAKSTCSRDYQCASGVCKAKTVDSCKPSQCEKAAGCDAKTGCVFAPLDVSMVCDDGDKCTDGDHCSGSDGQCVSTPKSCDDGIGCTVDACDASGTCTHTASDALCSGPCKTGTCNATMDCLNVTFSQDFTDCTDSHSNTAPDLCYRGECLGGRQGAPTASCALAGCTCSGFSNVRDLQFLNGKFAGLIETVQSGGGGSCASGTVSNVFDVTLGALTAYGSTDTSNGGVTESASDLDMPYVITTGHVGLADPSTQTVQWTSSTFGAAFMAQTSGITNYRGSARHFTGSFASTIHSYFWMWGLDSSTLTTARLARCDSCSSNIVGGCTTTGITCADVFTNPSSSFVAVLPYTKSGVSNVYGGTLALTNYSSGSVRKRIYEDGTGKDMVPSSVEADDADGAWSGLLRLSAVGQVLAFGSGSNNVRVCTDASNTGDTTCVVVSGLPSQGVRAYTRADTNSSAVVMLASTGTNNYLLMLPSGLDPAVGGNWREITIANSSSTTANAVAMSPTSFMVLGRTSNVPYVWYWGP